MATASEPEQPPAPVDTRPIEAQSLDKAVPGALAGVFTDRGETTLTIHREHIRNALRALRDDPELDYQHLRDVTAVDYLQMGTEPRFSVVYHLLSTSKRKRLRLKVGVPEGDETVQSVTPEWPTADFLEREVYDLMGIRFTGHPDLRRIVMPHDWQTYPLRKDVPLGEEPVAFSNNAPPNEPA